MPSGYPHPDVCVRKELCIPSGEQLHLCPCCHAESNTIDNAARHGITLKDSIMYCTTYPCSLCMSRIVNAGISEVIYDQSYPDLKSEEIAKNGNVKIRAYKL